MPKRVELSERQVADLERYLDQHRSEDEETKSDAAHGAVGYLRAALYRQSDPDSAE